MSEVSWWPTVRRIGIVVSAAGCAVLAVLLAVAALRPDQPLPPPLAEFWDPQSWQIVTLAIVWGGLLAAFILVGRRPRQSARPLLALVAMGAVAVGLGFAAYLPCTGDGVPFWTPLSWGVAVFVGSAGDPFGTTAGCPDQAPLALLVARYLAVATVGLGFVAAASVLFRSQLDVLRMRRSRSRIVLDGPLDVTLRAATRIRDRVGRRTLVVVRADASDPPPPAHRQQGIVLLRWPDPVDFALRAFSMRRGRVALTALYLLGPEAGVNLSRFERLADGLAAASVPLTTSARSCASTMSGSPSTGAARTSTGAAGRSTPSACSRRPPSDWSRAGRKTATTGWPCTATPTWCWRSRQRSRSAHANARPVVLPQRRRPRS